MIYLIMLRTCEIKLFAEDTKIYSIIKDTSNTLLLQKNLNMINKWSHKWLFKFHTDKFKLLYSWETLVPPTIAIICIIQMNNL